MRKITAVTFDLWDTLIQEHPGGSDKVATLRIERIGKLLSSRGIPYRGDEVREAYNKTGEFLNLTWSKARDVAVRDQVLFMLSSIDGKLASRLGKADVAEVERIYVDSILDNPPMLLQGVKEVLRALKARSFKIGLISNTGRTTGTTLRVVLQRMGIGEYFDTMTFSNEVLLRKPSPGVFRVTLEKLRAVPKASVHVGDDYEKDFMGAKKAGMHAIHLVATKQRSHGQEDGTIRSLDELVDKVEDF